MQLERNAKLLRVFLDELDKSEKGTTLYESIVLAARKEGIAGATVLRGVLSYGASSHLHSAKWLELSHDLPIVIEIVDTAEKINTFLPVIDQLLEEAACGAMVTLEGVEVLRYTSRK